MSNKGWTLPDFKFGGSIEVPRAEFDEEMRQRAEWLEFEAAALDRGVCPHSGEVLYRGGEAGPEMLSCDMCDCFGYDPEEVPNPVDPLTCDREMLYHWKGCLQCECPPEAYHALDCPASPIYAEIMAEGWMDTREIWPWHQMRMICRGSWSVIDGHVCDWHILGEINGPRHYCDGQRRIVEQGE